MVEQPSNLGAGAIWSMLDNLSQQVLSFLIFIVLARFVAPQEFGLIAIAHVIVTFVRQTVFDAIAYPVARSASPSDALYSSAFCVCVLAALLMSALMLSSAGPVSRFYALPELMRVLSWMSLVVLALGTSAVFEARLIRRMEFRPLAIRSIVSVAIGGGVGIALAFAGEGVMALVAQQVLTSCIALALLVAQARWLPRLTLRNLSFREFLPDASRVSVTGLFGFLANQGDTFLVSVLMGSYATGIYGFAKRLTSSIYLVIGSSLLKLAVPAFADEERNPDVLREAYVRILGMSIFLMAPLLAGLSVLAGPAITLIFGAVWAPAAPIVALLALLYLLLAANQVNDYLLFAVGARTVPVLRGLMQTSLALVMGWLGSRFGLVWTAAGFVLAGLVVWPWAQRIANGYMNFSFLKMVSALSSPILATCAMSLSLVLILERTPVSAYTVIGMVALGAAVFLFAHVFVTRASPASHDALKELIRLRPLRR